MLRRKILHLIIVCLAFWGITGFASFHVTVKDIHKPYSLNSSDYSDFIHDINQLGPRPDTIATLNSQMRVYYNLKEQEQCIFDVTRAEFAYTFNFPTLSNKARIKKLPSWEVLMDEIKRHEEEHKAINLKTLKTFLSEIDGLAFPSCEKAVEYYHKAKQDAYRTLEQLQVDFDKQGVDSLISLKSDLKREWMQRQGIALSFQN